MTVLQDDGLRGQELRGARVDRLVVVGEAADVPQQVRDWCRATGRELCTPGPRTGGPGRRPTPLHRLGGVAALFADPVLVVRPGCTRAPILEVTAALHGLPDDAPVLAAAVDAARHLGGRLVLVHGLPVSFAERSVGLGTALRDARGTLDAARRLVDDARDVEVVTRLVRVHPHELVGEDLDTGLLVLGGPRRDVVDDGPGLVARSALNHATCPLLIVPR
jgi:nucleotide-binding universal stress UspA family protein